MLIAFLQNAILYMDFLYLIEIEISRWADDTVYKIFQDQLLDTALYYA